MHFTLCQRLAPHLWELRAALDENQEKSLERVKGQTVMSVEDWVKTVFWYVNVILKEKGNFFLREQFVLLSRMRSNGPKLKQQSFRL